MIKFEYKSPHSDYHVRVEFDGLGESSGDVVEVMAACMGLMTFPRETIMNGMDEYLHENGFYKEAGDDLREE